MSDIVLVAGNAITLVVSTAPGQSSSLSVVGQYAPGTGTTFSGTNVSGSMTVNTVGINMALSVAPALSMSAGPVANTFSAVTFQNSNGVSFGLNAQGTMTASVAGQSTQTQPAGGIAGTRTAVTGNIAATLNSSGLSLNAASLAGTGFVSTTYTGVLVAGALNSAGLTLSVPPYLTTSSQSVQTQNVNNVSLSGNTSGTLALISSGTWYLAGGNNITLSQNANSVTISANTAAAATLSFSAGTTSSAVQGLTFSNSNNISFGLNAGVVTASASAQSVQTQASGAIAGTGFTTTTTAGVSVAGTNNTAGLKLAVPSFVTAGLALYDGANSITSGTVHLTNANGVTLTINGQTLSGSVRTDFAGTNTSFAGTNISGSMTVNTSGISLALSGGTGGGGGSTGDIFLAGNTTGQSSSSTYQFSSVNFSGAGIISLGWSSNSLIVSAPASTSIAYVGTGTTFSGTNASASITLNSNGMNMALSAAAAGGGGVNIAASNTTFTSGTVVLSAAGGALTISNGAQSALFSVPQTSSIIGNNGLSVSTTGSTVSLIPQTSSLLGINGDVVSTNGSTISIGPTPLARMDFWPGGAVTSAQQVQASASIRYLQMDWPVSFTRVDVPILVSINTAVTLATADLNISSGLFIYSLNGSTLSPIAGVTGNQAYTWDSNATASVAGARNASFGIATALTPGEYWIGFQLSTTNNSSIGTATTVLGNTISVLQGLSYTASQIGDFGSTYAASQNIVRQGMYSGTISATAQTVALSDLAATGTGGQAGNFPVIFRNY